MVEVYKVQVANAIKSLQDPFTPCQIIDELGLEQNKENHAKVMEVLHHFVKRQWVSNSHGNLFFRSFEEFRF